MENALLCADRGLGSSQNGYIWIFAIGPHIYPNKFRQRGMPPLETKRGFLSDWCMVFDGNAAALEVKKFTNAHEFTSSSDHAAAPCRAPSTSDHALRNPRCLHGVLTKLKRPHFAELVREECYYDVVEVLVEVYPDDCESFMDAMSRQRKQQNMQPALVFVSQKHIAPGALPGREYIEKIAKGARLAGLQESYCRWLEAIADAVANRYV